VVVQCQEPDEARTRATPISVKFALSMLALWLGLVFHQVKAALAAPLLLFQ
jgi:hypothetical protein